MLGLVLCVLFFKVIPDKDKQIVDLIDKKDASINALIAAFRAEAREQREDQAQERERCQRNYESIARSIETLAAAQRQSQHPGS